MAFVLQLPVTGRVYSRTSKNQRPKQSSLSIKAVAAPELSPEKAGTAGAKNQLEALKQMSKIVADSGVNSLAYKPFAC